MLKIRVGLVGCGNVAMGSYLPDLKASPHTELVAVCDADRACAQQAAEKFGVSAFHDAAEMLRRARFELFVNTTSMPLHAPLNLMALRAGRHVWCEKPMATDLADARAILREARRRRLLFRAAPNAVLSPAFRAAAQAIARGEIGKVCQARGRYGHAARGMWSAWFFQKGGGSLFDLGVYNVTTLTGLLGPACGVMAMSGIAMPKRKLKSGQRVRASVEDNTVVMMEFNRATFGIVQTGFVFQRTDDRATIEVIGTEGTINVLGWDWEPRGIEIFTNKTGQWQTRATDPHGYHWRGGASYLARCLATGEKSILSAEHAYHVLEVMLAALKSARTGRRIKVHSRFPYPIGCQSA